MKFPYFRAAAGAALLAAFFLSGCAYRSDLAQGNFVEQSAVDKLRVGMTPEQVRFILGTPMLIDPFDSSRWYYVHYLRQGWSDPKIENLILLFQGGTLAAMQGDFKAPAEFSVPLDMGAPAPAPEESAQDSAQ
ncbi:MAG: outer membrane protein assembly factor BamE [Succinivibrio sp.]|nr:outer membrane protein assembly factor BamE [Succinivibrio sp.]